jgi:hypothetical protein
MLEEAFRISWIKKASLSNERGSEGILRTSYLPERILSVGISTVPYGKIRHFKKAPH